MMVFMSKYVVYGLAKTLESPIEWLDFSVSGLSRARSIWVLGKSNKCKKEVNEWVQSLNQRYAILICAECESEDEVRKEFEKASNHFKEAQKIRGLTKGQSIRVARDKAYFELQNKIVEFVLQHPNASKAEIAYSCGIHLNSVYRSLKRLAKEGMISSDYGNSIRQSKISSKTDVHKKPEVVRPHPDNSRYLCQVGRVDVRSGRSSCSN
jgi:Fe2+ or Zn2+ uptake regulation protein